VSKPNFGAFENYPARFTDDEAWVFEGKNWTMYNPAEVAIHAGLMSEAGFKKEFGPLPPLPPEAFK
jgi:hypothetical protein